MYLFIIFYFLYSSHYPLTVKASNFFDDVEKGDYICRISSFTETEFLGVIKNLLCEKKNRPPTIDEVEAILREFNRFISEMGIELHDADALAIEKPIEPSTIFSLSEKILDSATPFLGKRDKKWHSLKGADALHVALAIRVKAESYATFDDDFRGVSSWITPIMLSEVY